MTSKSKARKEKTVCLSWCVRPWNTAPGDSDSFMTEGTGVFGQSKPGPVGYSLSCLVPRGRKFLTSKLLWPLNECQRTIMGYGTLLSI